MRNIIATIAVLLSVCANAQYKEMLHAHITPTNKVVVGIPDWAKSDTPPEPEIVVIGTNDVVNIISNEVSGIVDSKIKSQVEGSYVPLIQSYNGRTNTALVGTLKDGYNVGNRSLLVGEGNAAEQNNTIVGGRNNIAFGQRSICIGDNSRTYTDSYAFGINCEARAEGALSVGRENIASSKYSIALGIENISNGRGSFSVGENCSAQCAHSIALGYNAKTDWGNQFTWNGDAYSVYTGGVGHTVGSFNINPVGGLSGFYIGETNMATILSSAAKMEFNEIEPKINDNEIILHPIDNKANWVNGIVEVNGKAGLDIEFVFTVGVEIALESGGTKNYQCTVSPDLTLYNLRYEEYVGTFVIVDVKNDVILKDEHSDVKFGIIPSGTRLELVFIDVSFTAEDKISGYIPAFDTSGSFFNVDLASTPGAMFEIYRFSSADSYAQTPTEATVNYPHVVLPAYTDTTKVRIFSLTLSTNADGETDVTWEGGRIIEAYSGSSNIIPGTNTFLVYESEPSNFVIDRIPRADSNSSILTEDGKIQSELVQGMSNGSEIRTADAIFRSMDNQNVLWTYVSGETVWIAVTNYMRTVQGVAPSFQLWEVRDGNTNCVYWSAEEIDIRVGDKIDVAVTNAVKDKADKAWAKYQSMTGADNPQPNDITIVSTPSVMLSGGYEWQRFVDTGNEVWILKCNCPTMLGSSSVSNGVNTGNGYFKITDAEGKTHFSVEKTDSKLVDAVPDSVSFSNDGNGYFQVSFQSNVKPSLYVSADLNTPFIECKEDSENDYGLTCSWSEANGIYTASIIYNPAEGKPSKLFAYGKVMQEGSVVIKNTAATSFDGGIIIGGNKYTIGTAVIDGKTVLTLENGQAVNE